MKKELKPLKSVALLIIHCVGNRCDRPFSTESLINTGLARFGQVSYHWYIKRDGTIDALLPENVQGIHARHYNHCSLGIVYEGGLTPKGRPDDTRTEAQKASMRALLEELTETYPEAHIMGHCELPHVAKDCPCFPASKFYADLQPENRQAKVVSLN
jgi:N-acetyl-anhydromuramyl-L-alanine amidase AmpD